MTGDMRDRLIELLKSAPFCGYRFDGRYSVGAIATVADHLIANGVELVDADKLITNDGWISAEGEETKQ